MSLKQGDPSEGRLGQRTSIESMTNSVITHRELHRLGVAVYMSLVEGPWSVQLADDQSASETHEIMPPRVTLHTAWGSVTLDRLPYAVIPGADDVIILGRVSLAMRGVRFKGEVNLTAGGQRTMPVTGVENPDYHECCGVAPSTFQGWRRGGSRTRTWSWST